MFTVLAIICGVQMLALACMIPLCRMARLDFPASPQKAVPQRAQLARPGEEITYPGVPFTDAARVRMARIQTIPSPSSPTD